MNLTIDQFIEGLERSVRELPAVLRDWNKLDDDLQDEYADQLLWLLRARTDVLNSSGHRLTEIALRVGAATSALLEVREEIRVKMGIPSDRIVPFTAFSAKGDPPLAMAV